MSAISYTITINNPGGAGAPNDGFIDQMPVAQLSSLGSLNYESAKAKKRANFRYRRIIQVLGTVANPIVTAVNSSSTAVTEGSSIQITVTFDRGAIRIIRDENELSGSLAIQQLVAEAITETHTHLCDIIDPVLSRIAKTENLVVGPIFGSVAAAKTQITVTQI